MKKIVFLVVSIIVLSFASCEEEHQAPQIVKDAFSTKFPSATQVEWEKESDIEWEVEFKENGKQYSANFLEDGTWRETEFVINKQDVPTNIMAVFNIEFAEYKIEEIELSETPKGLVYEFVLVKGEEGIEVAIDASGNIIKKEQKEEESKVDND